MRVYYWQPSSWLYLLMFLLLLLAVFALLSSALAIFYKALLLVFYTLYAVLIGWRLAQFKQTQQVFGLRYAAKSWQLWTSQSGWQAIKLSAQTIVLPWLVIIYYRKVNQRFARALVIPEHVLDAESHRKLRVQLRFLS